MEQVISAILPPEEVAELDRVCRRQGVSRLDAVQEALHWYIDREGNLPTIDYGHDLDLA